MNYTPKPSSRITPSISENRMKIRSVDFEFSAFRQTDVAGGLCFIYIDSENNTMRYLNTITTNTHGKKT